MFFFFTANVNSENAFYHGTQQGSQVRTDAVLTVVVVLKWVSEHDLKSHGHDMQESLWSRSHLSVCPTCSCAGCWSSWGSNRGQRCIQTTAIHSAPLRTACTDSYPIISTRARPPLSTTIRKVTLSPTTHYPHTPHPTQPKLPSVLLPSSHPGIIPAPLLQQTPTCFSEQVRDG